MVSTFIVSAIIGAASYRRNRYEMPETPTWEVEPPKPETLGTKIGFWITVAFAVAITPWVYFPTLMYALVKHLGWL